jgi:thioredoxin 1
MKRFATLLFAAVSTLALAGDFPSGSPAFGQNFKKTAKEAESTGKPVIAVFSASWCGPCQMMKKDVYPSSAVKPFHDKFLWVYLDVDLPENQGLASKLGVGGIPDIRFLSAKGKELGSQVGSTTPGDFANTLEGVLKKAAK